MRILNRFSFGNGGFGKGKSRSSRQRRQRLTPDFVAAKACFEPLEIRMLLSASLSLSGLQTITPSSAIDVSNDAANYQSEMSADINPHNPLNVAGISHRIASDLSTISIDVFYSNNGGDTWTTNNIDGSDDSLGLGIRFDPSIKFDLKGHLYIAYGFDNGSTTRLIVARSDNGGQTFTQFRTLENRANIGSGPTHTPGVDKWQLATGFDSYDIFQQDVYIAYTQNVVEGTAVDQRIVVTGSNDLGSTFATPVIVNDGSISGTDTYNLYAQPSIGKGGELYVSWHDIDGNAIRFDRDLDGLFRSTYSFGTDITVRSLSFNSLNGAYVPAQPERGIDTGPVMDTDRGTFEGMASCVTGCRVGTGTIYITFVEWAGASGYNTVIRLATSTNDGTSWTIKTVESAAATNFLPWVTVDQASGAPGVLYYTTAGNTAGDSKSVRPRLAVSSDSGVTFGRANVTNAFSNEDGGDPNDYLEYIGLGFFNGTAQAFWSARPSGSSIDQEAYTARAYLRSVSGLNTLYLGGEDFGPASGEDILVQKDATNPLFVDAIVH
ncbi:MAG: BNR/Asp-box repeat protein, partial [Capsulimonas sp.]|nr:BNR/Asp-box repeat protein [Capsulimonas sp.]